jgi:hypothetical protein
MSKGSRINSTHAPERYSATEPLVRFSSTPTICPLHFTVEWADEFDELLDAKAFLVGGSRAVGKAPQVLDPLSLLSG